MDLWESIAGCAASSVVNWLVCIYIQTMESMVGCYCVKRAVVGIHTDIVKVCLAAIGSKKLRQEVSVGRLGVPPFLSILENSSGCDNVGVSLRSPDRPVKFLRLP